MTTYYVSPSGNDSNNGLGPDASHASNKPWLTIGKALGAAGIASGDTVYIGPGTYREVVTVAMTSATAETSVLGDPLNAQGFKNGSGVLLTPGEVVWTAYTTNDTTAASANPLLTLAGRDFLTFQYLTIIGGNTATGSCVLGTTTNSVNIVFRDCKMISTNTGSTCIAYTGLADVAANWTFDRCRIFHVGTNVCFSLTFPTSASADYDTNFVIQNCEVISTGQTAVFVNTSGASSFKPGGVDVISCTLFVRLSALQTNTANVATSIPCTCNNSIIIAITGPALNANTSGQITENYCRIIAASARTNVTAGANSISDMSHAPLFDLGYAQHLSFMPRPFWGPMASSPLLGFGSTGAPSVDVLNRPRPAGGQSISNTVGANERHDTAAQETSVTQAGSSAIKIVGPGDQDVLIPVDASSTTISIYARYDSTHAATNKPQAILLANDAIGVTTQTLTMTAAADTWEQLTFSAQTPTAKGYVTIRLVSRAAAGGGIAYFDTAAGGAQGTQGLDYFRGGEPLTTLVATGGGGSIKVHPSMQGGANG